MRAVPREREEFHWWAPGLVVIGADSYVFTVDSTRGVVLHVSISIRGQVGRLGIRCPACTSMMRSSRSSSESRRWGATLRRVKPTRVSVCIKLSRRGVVRHHRAAPLKGVDAAACVLAWGFSSPRNTGRRATAPTARAGPTENRFLPPGRSYRRRRLGGAY